MIKNFLCFNQIIDTLRIDDQDALLYYLDKVYVRLSKKDKERLTYYKISKYINIPTFIAKKTYRNFDKNGSNKVDGEEFIRGMMELYSHDYFILTKSYFDILDFTRSGKIYKDDVRIFFHHLKPVDNFYHFRETLHNILNDTFKDKEFLYYKEFLDVIENVNSDIFFILFVYYHEKQPYSNNVVKFIYSLSDLHNTSQLSIPNSPLVLKRNLDNSKNLNESIKKIDVTSRSSIPNNSRRSRILSDLGQKESKQKLKHLLVAPTKNIIIFSSQEIYNNIIHMSISVEIKPEQEEEIPLELTENYYVRHVPGSLNYKIGKMKNTRSVFTFKKASVKLKLNNAFSFVYIHNIGS
jgi:hypothetical protein